MRLSRLRIAAFVLSCTLAAFPSYSKEKKATSKKDAAPAAQTTGAKVDINSASQADLDKLPGVGPATAKKIVAARPYTSVADLSRAGVPAKTIANITPLVTVGGAAAAKATVVAKEPPAPTHKAAIPPPTAMPSNTQAPGGGNGQVWVNTETKVYHRQGDRWYGKTKNGKYMSEAEAQRAGYRDSKQDPALKK